VFPYQHLVVQPGLIALAQEPLIGALL
jgi:hypothetical protein